MIDFLLARNIMTLIGAIVLLAVLYFIQLFIDDESDFASPIWLAMAFVAIYLLWHGGAWLMARFMDTVHSYR